MHMPHTPGQNEATTEFKHAVSDELDGQLPWSAVVQHAQFMQMPQPTGQIDFTKGVEQLASFGSAGHLPWSWCPFSQHCLTKVVVAACVVSVPDGVSVSAGEPVVVSAAGATDVASVVASVVAAGAATVVALVGAFVLSGWCGLTRYPPPHTQHALLAAISSPFSPGG